MILHGDCLEMLKTLPDNSVDSLVTDPPAGISFMGKSWDDDKGGRTQWIAWLSQVMTECKRVMKPGAHGLVWAIPRTSHWTATALEDAGFEIRDVITHLFGSGFPKSLDISKAIDKAAGAQRTEILGFYRTGEGAAFKHSGNGTEQFHKAAAKEIKISAPATDAAKQWQGWGTALKPASEHWILIRKPIEEKTVAANVLKHGCGGINIDGCRIGVEQRTNKGMISLGVMHDDGWEPRKIESIVAGRFPANLVLSHSEHCTDEACDMFECPVALLDEQSGNLGKSAGGNSKNVNNKVYGKYVGELDRKPCGFGDSGGASRFFYCAKVSTSERNAGLEGMPDVTMGIGDERPSGQSMQRLDGRDARVVKNHHPTVKPQKLMRYLCRLITPPGGTVLDPFMGSGSTGCAAVSEGFKFIGIEREFEYCDIATKRIQHWSSENHGN